MNTSHLTTPITAFRGNHAFLSNMHPAPVMLDGMRFATVEHGYQAAKTLNLRERAMIQACSTPHAAKNNGALLTMRKDWDAVKFNIMRDLLRAKFQSIALRALLLATGERELIESNNWNDTFWGVHNGVGDNHLGKLLMEVRAEYRK